jgi:hypothetical protein
MRKPNTWGSIYRKALARGLDHGLLGRQMGGKMYAKIYRWLTWATVEEACAPEGRIAWHKKLARRLLPTPRARGRDA